MKQATLVFSERPKSKQHLLSFVFVCYPYFMTIKSIVYW